MSSLAKIVILVALLSSCAAHQTQPGANSTQSAPALSESELDAALQKTAEESLGEREGAVIVIDPQNGRLRAVANPRIAFEQTFPPGSAIKPFTALAALRAGLIDRELRHQCRTRYARDDFEIVCSHPVSKSPFSLSQALAYSCNDFFARVSERLSEGVFNSTLGAFGFGEKTGLNANESSGELPRGEWGARDALGESDHLLVTPVQLITAYAALVNGGHLYRPQRTTDHNLTAQERLRLNVAPEHRAALIEGMRGSVKYGTASKAGVGLLPGYVFGKTGTSTSSIRWRTQGWFVGFAAEKNPVGPPRDEQVKFGVLVFLKRAHGSQAAEVAKPIFDCGLRIADCGLRKKGSGEWGMGSRETVSLTPFPTPYSPLSSSNPQSIRVHSVSEKVTRELPLEEYLTGVLAAESSIENETEALKAQAIVSRAFALKNLGRHARDGYDFCSTTHCQRFTFPKTKNSISGRARRAIEETAGVILSDSLGNVIDAYFHAACGGMTANIGTLWGAPAPSYLRGVRDDFCATMPHRRWTQQIPANQLTRALQSDERANVGARLVSITVSKRDATGRAETLIIEGARRRLVRGWDFKIIVGRVLGWQMIKSSRFEVSRAGDDFVFRGFGFGHGLGFCQEGAHVAARRGMSYRQILNHYFPETRLTRLAANRFERSSFQTPPTASLVVTQISSLKRVFLRRIAAPEFSRGFQPTGWLANIPTSRQRRLNSIVADATWDESHGRCGLKPTAKLKAPLRGGKSRVCGGESRSPLFAEIGAPPNGGTQKSSLSSEHFRATYPAKADMRSIENMLRAFENARADLLRRLEAASLRLAEPGPFEVVVHATTADFIAATGQGGWAAGATRGRRIELQPLELLRRRGVLNATLRHEMTHAVIETLGGGRAPRWMAEGLAIYVAGEAASLQPIENKNRLTREALERKLMRMSSVTESRKLYAMAYHEICAMIEAEGEASVWRRVAHNAARVSKRSINSTARVSKRSIYMSQQDREEMEEGALHTSHESRFHSTEELIDEELRCVQCDARVKDVVCGHRNPCPFCGFPYPVGDCSDLVEN
jgi:SpoIID/LytB domain protein